MGSPQTVDVDVKISVGLFLAFIIDSSMLQVTTMFC